MLLAYCGFGAFLIVTMVLCAFGRRSSVASVARLECTEQMTAPLIEDANLSTECMIQI
jgi:hypothetical protein